MRKLFILVGLILMAAGSAAAQDYPKAEIFGGYQYIRFNPGGGATGSNCQGGAGSVAGNLNHWFGVVGDFGACRVTGLPSGTSAHLVNYLFGPKLTYRSRGRLSPFAQVLFGGERIGGSATGFGSASTNAFAMTFGGGADYEMTNHVAIRLIQGEYLYTKFGGTHQNNARISAGIVYRWGGK
jgi:opacity protein-like surface antigen